MADADAGGTARANGLELRWESFGEASAPAMLLIMGLGAQMILWREGFCRALADRGFRVIRFDNRDIGESSRVDAPAAVDFPTLIQKQMKGEPIEAPYTLDTMADDSVGLLDALGIDKAHVVGASMGGMIAQQMAVRHPDRVASLTSIMSTTGNPGLPGPAPEAAAVLMAPPPKTRDDYIAGYGPAWRVLRAGAFPADEAQDPALAARLWDRGLNPAGVARQMLAIFASGDRRKGLASITAPTLVLHGEVDPLVRPEGGRDTAANIPGAKLLMMPRMGHALPEELWPQIVDAIAAHAKAAA